MTSRRQRVAITGASGLIGGALSSSLRADGHEVVQLVRHEPKGDHERPWDPATRELDPGVLSDVDTVVHMGVIATPRAGGGRATQKEVNVIGTMQLLAACQRAESVTKLVVKSTGGVYGSSPRDPAMFTEDMSAKRLPPAGWARDSVEVEGYVRGFARRRPDVEITTLRFANVIGPRVRTAMTEHFSLPVIPIPMGFDARLQFVHEDDCVAAMAHAVSNPGVGAVNVVGDGIITASQAANISGRPYALVPRMSTGAIAGVAKRLGLVDIGADQIDMLTFGRGLDTTRMHDEMGFEPVYSSRAAFEDFARSTSGRVLDRLPLGRPGWAAVHATESAMRLVGANDESEK